MSFPEEEDDDEYQPTIEELDVLQLIWFLNWSYPEICQQFIVDQLSDWFHQTLSLWNFSSTLDTTVNRF